MSEEPEPDLCCPPDCCDMRGFLTFQILWELSRDSLNGQQIAERIAERRGTKPTPGTIYPALKELKDRGLIVGTRDGREIEYSLTDLGREGLDDAARYFYQLFGDILEECKEIVFQIGECNKC
ncbi:MAG: PadR family transcriptional regulator [Candidatus Thorarchaeota archaeon]|nr:PadR family transcriptional regulator [Candidatus Thorarchaeota archaeon]